MILHNEKQASFLVCKCMVNNTILNILLILFYSVFKTLKRKFMLNLASSDGTSKRLLPVSAIITDLTACAFVGFYVCTCIVLHGYFSLDKTRGPTTKAAGSDVLRGTVQHQELMY